MFTSCGGVVLRFTAYQKTEMIRIDEKGIDLRSKCGISLWSRCKTSLISFSRHRSCDKSYKASFLRGYYNAINKITLVSLIKLLSTRYLFKPTLWVVFLCYPPISEPSLRARSLSRLKLLYSLELNGSCFITSTTTWLICWNLVLGKWVLAKCIFQLKLHVSGKHRC